MMNRERMFPLVFSDFLEACEDYVADSESCTKFVRCFANIRMRFTCPPGTAWEDSLKTCARTEQVEACQRTRQQRKTGNSFHLFNY